MSSSMTAGYELSPQQKLFFVHGSEASVVGMALALEGEIDSAKVRSAVEQLVQRHEILRTTFQRRTGMRFPFQVVHDHGSLAWSATDLSAVNAGQQVSEIEHLISDASGIDVENGPVSKATLAFLGPERHALLFAFSALCVDDASLTSLVAEFAQLYFGGSVQSEVLQYADYSEWQSGVFSSDDSESKQALAFWEQTQFGSLPKLSLPFERKQAAGAHSWTSVPVSLELDSQNVLTPEFLFALWQAFLARISGREEFILGFVSDGRNHEEFEGATGLFSRILPVHVTFNNQLTVGNSLKHASASLASALDHQDYFSVDRLPDQVSVGFAWCRTAKPVTLGNQRISELSRGFASPGFNLQLRCVPSSEPTRLFLDYDRAWFSPDVIAQTAERFAIFIAGAVTKPTAVISTLPIMSDTERQKVLFEFNQASADYPLEKCIHELFEQRAAEHPERPALRFADRQFTYAELNGAANRIAHVLRQNGVNGNAPVALCLERSAEMIIALLGVLKAGACYVPLVPDNPKPRLAHQLSETAAPVILTEQKHLGNLPDFKGKVICLDRDRALLEGAPSSSPGIKTSPQDLVYVIYTSGSTGLPKGVAVQHFNLVNYSHFICKRLKVEEHAEGLNFATVSTISADLGNTCIFPSLISGGCLHVIPYETAMSPALFSEYTSEHPVDVLKITPSHLSSLLGGKPGDSVLPQKYLILGGEATRWDLVERIRSSGKCALLNHYGPTEATVGCCTFAAEKDVQKWEPATLPIGKPIANDEIYILDSHMEPMPIGVAGELCIGGIGLARGYLNQPAQTAERFVRNPFSSDPEARLYRTGDLARFLPDGNIEFLGRIDAQVKIRGFRVEPAEIESVLKKYPGVAQVAVVPYDVDAAEKKLAAYVVPRTQTRAEDLRGFLLQQLPDYMVPSAFVSVESLPLTPNGKLDVRALPAPEQQPTAQESVAPRTPDEEKLAAIWQEVLKRDQVGVTDNFFELGGHSLLATQIISRIRNSFRVQMPLHAFLQSPTIAALAEQIPQCPAIESEQEEMARLLQELEGISDEEAERLLAGDVHNRDEGGR